ncbi:MAG: glycoside hydrolase family 104 protein [Rhodospirillales bacterium]|nr:glycoside hydrolase family 104 protein [Rhodospirillales bacterium]
MQKKAMDSIFLGETTIEDWRPTFESYLANSPLDQASTEALVAETERAIASFELPIQLQDELTNWTQYTDTDAGGLPAGMPGYAVGLSQAIAAVESNGGDYAVMNGGERITDFSDHPRRVGTRGTSTAAGKYQFIESTWDEAVAALGLPDFSPASQEKAFWWYAGKRYTQATGRNIEADLASNDPVLVENVRKTLAGTGSGNDAVGVVWEGLQHMSSQDFFSYVTGGRTIPPGAMSDPAYESLSEIEKANMLVLAQQQSSENIAAALKLQNQQREMLLGQAKDAIIGGGMTQQQLSAFIGSQGLTQEAASELQNLFNTHNSDEVNLGKFGLALQTGGASFGPDERKGFDVLYARESSKAVGELDQEYMNSTLLPFIGRAGYFPSQLVTDLTNMARGSDPQRAAFAMQNLALLEQQNENGFTSAFGEKLAGEVDYFRAQSNYYPPTEVIARMAQQRDALMQSPRETVEKAAKAYVERYASSFSATGIMSELGYDISLTTSDFSQTTALESEFREVFMTEMMRFRDEDVAYEAAVKRVSGKWASVSYGSEEPYLLRNAPALVGVSPIGGIARSWLTLTSARLWALKVTIVSPPIMSPSTISTLAVNLHILFFVIRALVLSPLLIPRRAFRKGLSSLLPMRRSSRLTVNYGSAERQGSTLLLSRQGLSPRNLRPL